MIITLELTATQEARLRAKAAAAGQETAAYLLTIAEIADAESVDEDEASAGSAYDLFEGLLDGWGSGGGNLSENCGDKFAEGMTKKQEQGHL